MTRHDFAGAPCVEEWDLFDATYRAAHKIAAGLCLGTCEHLTACEALRQQMFRSGVNGGRAWLSGTWAGVLHKYPPHLDQENGG